MKKYCLLIIALFTCSAVCKAQRWSAGRAAAWYKKQPWLVGANYTPAYAVNQLEFWQVETFDPAAIDKELGWAENLGMNAMRVYLHHELWLQDKQGFKNRVSTLLNIAARHHIRIAFVLFDDCWNDTYHTGKQPLPKPGIHNSGWLKDPGNRVQGNQALLDTLGQYTKDLLHSFKHHPQILFWDLYNEPGQFDQHHKSLPLLQAVFKWAREVHPDQPLTSAVYEDSEKEITHFQIASSDVITYHSYDPPVIHQRRIDSLRNLSGGRPLICTEFMARKWGSTLQAILPMLKKQRIGAFNWGLVDGKTQTKYAWDEKDRGTAEPKLWFHEVLRKDGSPYDPAETDLIRVLTHRTNHSPLATAQWITTSEKEPETDRPVLIFKKSLTIAKPVKSAKLYITAHGLYEAQLNGRRLGDGYFTPGYTEYHQRLQYQVYPIALVKNSNELRVTLGDGFYRGDYLSGPNIYGTDASVLAKLEVLYQDGGRETILSDDSWQWTTGPIRSSSLYNGELQDANIQAEHWRPVKVLEFPKENLVPTIGQSVKKHEVFPAKKLIGTDILDFGQNIAGWVRLKVSGKKGDTIKIYHAEMLTKDSLLWTKPLREAKALDTYILKGGGIETFEPHFTYHGFRYIQVKGTKVNPANYQAIALYTDLKRTGTFSCSNPKLNQLQHNIEWSMKGNFFDIPTDCPQRSERLGWTEDADVFAPTAAYLYDVKDFYKKWLADLAAAQQPNGLVPCVIPFVHYDRPVAAWSDAATFTPWRIYQAYGDRQILKDQYASMKAWVDYVTRISPDYLWQSKGYGDWYPAGPETPIGYLDQCYWYHSTECLVKTAELLHQKVDVKKYRQLLSKIRNAFNQTYLPHIPPTQSAYVVGLQFGLLPESAVHTLVKLVHENKDHLSTGFMGTPYLLHVLSRYGYSDLAYQILLQENTPSWLNMVNKGATTMWEKWDAVKADGTMLEDVSFNHYAFGSVGQWLYEHIAGIKAVAPGYRKMIIQPTIGGGLTWAKGSLITKYGKIASEWKASGKQTIFKISIPPGTTARICLPGRTPITLGAGNYIFKR